MAEVIVTVGWWRSKALSSPRLLALHLLLAVTLFFCATIGSARTEDALVTVQSAEIKPIVNVVRLSGTVVAPKSANVSTSVGGLVERIDVDLGDRVEAGTILVQLDEDLARYDVAQAEAAVVEAEAELADRRRRLRIAESLSESRFMSEDEMETRQTLVRVGIAVLAKLKAEAAHRRESLLRHTIKAPFDGVIARKATEIGEWVAPGTTIVELVAVTDLRVDIPVPQRHFPQLSPDTPVMLEFDALPGERFLARRLALVPVNDPTMRTFTLRVRPEDPDLSLTPGMSTRALLHLATGEQGIVIPRDAIIRFPDGRTQAWVIEGGDGQGTTAVERRIELGRATEGDFHVLSGIEAGDRVVVTGNESLRPGQRVRVVPRSS